MRERPSSAKVREVMDRLRGLGLPMREVEAPDPRAFLPGVWIDRGIVCVCPWAALPGDVIHEAGHLAVVPSQFRHVILPGPYDEIEGPFAQAVIAYTTSEEAFKLGPDHWLMRALMQACEEETVCWSYAATLAIGFPVREAFCHRYPDGTPESNQPFQGDGAEVLEELEDGDRPGIHGLQHAGMCRAKDWPRMLKWMQD